MNRLSQLASVLVSVRLRADDALLGGDSDAEFWLTLEQSVARMVRILARAERRELKAQLLSPRSIAA